ncbi:MAG: response regulator [Nitrospirae bacterium]|nr:response regulator [Nitrospirota bacterium]MCL5421627.1 response regulator [Nitrospirota bacterium]
MKKVIIAKDIKRVLEGEKSFLNRSGIRIFTAASNEKALALHRSVKADIIIAKLNMPEMSGERLCSLIRDDEELRSVSLIIICSDADADLERCVQCRANAFFSSPINSALLLQELHKLLHVAPRMSCRIPLSVKVRGKSKAMPFTGYTENISTSGMLFRSSALLFEGDVVTCSFSLPRSTQITANAEIVRFVGKEAGHDSNDYGIRFINPGPRAISALSAFLKKIMIR